VLTLDNKNTSTKSSQNLRTPSSWSVGMDATITALVTSAATLARLKPIRSTTGAAPLYGGGLDEDKPPVNVARYLFLDPHSRGFFLDWEMQAGRDVSDRAMSDLIGELSTRSDELAIRSARQNVRLHRTTRKRLHNRVVGGI